MTKLLDKNSDDEVFWFCNQIIRSLKLLIKNEIDEINSFISKQMKKNERYIIQCYTTEIFTSITKLDEKIGKLVIPLKHIFTHPILALYEMKNV